jgi:hypothetical protein
LTGPEFGRAKATARRGSDSLLDWAPQRIQFAGLLLRTIGWMLVGASVLTALIMVAGAT